jgi:peptidyl-prolyl cis-trans isomerase SurA
MNKFFFSLIAFFFLNYISFSNISKEVVAEVGSEKITIAELQRAYEKNLGKNETPLLGKSKEEFNRFLNMYIDYKLKVIDAKEKGFLNDPDVMAEVELNKQLIAKSFYLDKEFEEPRINEILNKRKLEFRFAYIIIPFQDENASGESRGTAYNVMERLKKGEDFGELAKIFSKDLKTASNGGVVESWVTGGQLQKQLETPLLTIKPGEIYPFIVETNYGFFILKLLEREQRLRHKGGHLLVQFQGNAPEDTLNAYNKMEKILKELKSGKKFEMLALEYSDDISTRDSGGRFSNWYSRSTGFENNGSPLVKPFEDGFNKLKPGEISDIVMTEYGLHLIKKYETQPLDEEFEIKKVKEVFKKAYHSKELRIFTDSIASMFGFAVFDNVRDDFQEYVDTLKTNLGTTWADSIPKKMYSKKLFSFNEKLYTVEDFINASNTDKRLKGFLLSDEGMYLAFMKMIEDDLFKLATQNLEKKYPEFSLISEEFLNGSILFKAEEIEVWQKNKLDSSIAIAYYDTTKNSYLTNWQYDLYEIFQFSEKNINATLEKLKNGEDFIQLASLETQREGFREKSGYRGILDAGKDPLAKKINPDEIRENEVYGPIELDRGFSLVKCVKKFPPRVMTLEEAFPLISPKALEISQNNLKEQWLNNVRQKHKVKINNATINKLFK